MVDEKIVKVKKNKKNFGKALKCGLVGVVIAGAGFAGGVYTSDDVKQLQSHTKYDVKSGFHKRPYDLRVEIKTDMDGNKAAFLSDAKTGDKHRIGEDMYVGDLKHNTEGMGYSLKHIFEDF